MSLPIETLLNGCESEKLHLSGSIQPFGALIRIDAETGRITHASANLADFIGIDPAAVLSNPAEDFQWLANLEVVSPRVV